MSTSDTDAKERLTLKNSPAAEDLERAENVVASLVQSVREALN